MGIQPSKWVIWFVLEIILHVVSIFLILMHTQTIVTLHHPALYPSLLDGIKQLFVPAVLNSSVINAIHSTGPNAQFANPTPTPTSVAPPVSAIRITSKSPSPSTPPPLASGTISLPLSSHASSTVQLPFLVVSKMTASMPPSVLCVRLLPITFCWSTMRLIRLVFCAVCRSSDARLV